MEKFAEIRKGKRSPRKKPNLESMKKAIEDLSSDELNFRSRELMEEVQQIDQAPGGRNLTPYKANIVEYLIKSIGGKDPVFVTEKEITMTDLQQHHDRIMFPKAKLEKRFLTVEEDEGLGPKKRMKVLLVEPSLKNMSVVKLGKWYMGKNVMYVLNGGWRHVATRKGNGLQKGQKVQLWSFRLPEYMGFVLTKVGF